MTLITVQNKNSTPAVSLTEKVSLVVITLILGTAVLIFQWEDRWMAAIFCTLPTFAGLLSYFRERLSQRSLLLAIGSAFGIHVLLIWVVFGILLEGTQHIGLFLCVPFIFIEGSLLGMLMRYMGTKTK